MIIKTFGGPLHGKRYDVGDEDICFVRHPKGHYARVSGGLNGEFYWREGLSVPLAVLQHGRYVLVEDAPHN